MTQSHRIGLFAAAGSANRLKSVLQDKSALHKGLNNSPNAQNSNSSTDTFGSKEILPVRNVRQHWHKAMQRLHPQNASEPHAESRPQIPVGDYLIDSYLHSDVNECIVVTRHDKTDLQQYYDAGKVGQMLLTTQLIDQSPGTPWTIAHGLQRVLGENATTRNSALQFAMGFPDIITSPHDVFRHLFDRLENSNADVVLGLFQVSNPQKYDMVRFHPVASLADSSQQAGRVTDIDIKPESSQLEWTWVCAVWNERFSHYVLNFTATNDPHVARATETSDGGAAIEKPPVEIYFGNVLISAMTSGFTIDCLCFGDGKVLDIGTPDDLELARSKAISDFFN